MGPVTAINPATLSCSDADSAAGDDPRGSAAQFDSFLLIEHRSSFGKEAAEDAVRAVYTQDADQVLSLPGLRPFAIRPVGRPETFGSTARFIGRTGPGSYLRETPNLPSIGDLAELADCPAPTSPEPLFAVCTNGSRDRCCAVKGRDLAARLRLELDGEGTDEVSVVEVSHLGGHRFAPTMLVLPWGYAYGRLDLESAAEIAYAAQDGLVHPSNLRGRADLSPAAQVADASWRAELGPARIDAVSIVSVQPDGPYHLVRATVQGRVEQLRLRQVPGETIVVTACGGKPIATVGWQIS
jgi:hypothetical protein